MTRAFRLLLTLLTLTCAFAASAQSRKGVSIIGDSYSTFKGFVTDDSFRTWYSTRPDTSKTDVRRVDQTWWHQLIRRQGYRLVTNNSYSGATICNTGYRKNDYTDRSFVTRLTGLGSPDIIYVFGGTNDDWAHSPLGEFKYSDWTQEDLYEVRPAVAYLISGLLDRYPGAEIVVIVNDGLSREVTETLVDIAVHYGVGCVRLHNIDKRAGHPTVKGMTQIASQIAAYENTRR